MARQRTVRGQARRYQMFIDGEWVDSKREETIDVINPATERIIASVPRANRDQAKAALEAAEKDHPEGGEIAPPPQAAVLFSTNPRIRRDKKRVARILTSGKHCPLERRESFPPWLG